MKTPSNSTGKRRGKRVELDEWLARVRPERVGELEFARILHDLAPVSDAYLRRLLRESGVPLAPTVEGVRQRNLDELHRTLAALSAEYQSGDDLNRAAIRRMVIAAKDHARLAPRKNPATEEPQKQEIVLWTITWLENPPLFPQWVKMRRARLNE